MLKHRVKLVQPALKESKVSKANKAFKVNKAFKANKVLRAKMALHCFMEVEVLPMLSAKMEISI